VRAIRNERRLSQEAVAESAGLGRGYVSELETGRRRPSFEALVLITEAMGVTMGELIAAYELRLRKRS
jgi:transcriptional regulator with XRE-family HTH domain